MNPVSSGKPGLPHKPGQKPAARPALRQPTAEERRRAQRVLLRMPVLVHMQGREKPVEAKTHTVSATGGTIILHESMTQGAKFILENPRTNEKVEVNVVRPSQPNADGQLVPVEFVTPAPKFWNVFFPPSVN